MPQSKTIKNEIRQKRRQNNKLKLIKSLGGKCTICGYGNCSAALHFHHVKPKNKKFGISDNYTNNFEKLQKEAKKCVLLCANCHAEVEFGFTSFSKLTKIEQMRY
jgi:5-methylcytosine-specific restriction endonuclease McrA